MRLSEIHSNKEPINILLVEDNQGDARLAMEALNSSSIDNLLHIVSDGEAALDFLYRRKMHQNAPRPDLVLLDLNLPKINGLDVLAIIKKDGTLENIPVVILSISQSEQDIEESYRLNANCFVSKPLHLDDFIEVFESILHFWLKRERNEQKSAEKVQE